MNIFCQETQEHIKALQQTEGALKLSSSGTSSDSKKQIIITPELWTEENRKDVPLKPVKERNIDKSFTEVSHNVEKNIRESLVSQTAMIPKLENMMEPKQQQVRHPRHQTSFRSKTEETSPRQTRSNQRPPRMTDREKIKQIRLRDNLPLYTPLRETCRSNSETFSIASLTSRCSVVSNNPTKSMVHQTNVTPSYASGMYTPVTSNQMFCAASLTGTASSHSKSNSLLSDRDLKSGDGRTSSDSCSSQSISPAISSQSQSTPVPPLYPPPNPFTHTPIPSYFANPSFPFPLPPPLSLYGGLYGPSPLLGSLSTPMPNMMPPNTLMMPYPFVLPLPIPLPIPVPVPQTFIDELNKKTGKSEVSTSNPHDTGSSGNENRKNATEITAFKLNCTKETARIKVEKDAPSTTSKETEKRYYIELDPGSNMKGLVSIASETEAMDLSTDTGHSRLRSNSPNERNQSFSQKPELLKENGNILVIQPEDSRLTPPKSPIHPLAGSCPANQKYSSRRNLILDATPNVQHHHREDSLSPSPEKRNYSSNSVRDMLYGKRKCIRSRIKTK